MTDEKKDEEKVSVSDRRRFAVEQGIEEGPETPPADHKGHRHGSVEAAIDFSTFMISLYSSALITLGEAPDPVSGHTRLDLGAARQTISYLEMLCDKTKGNRTAPEDKLVEQLLYDVRLRFVDKSKKPGGV
jgi:hypothetical protein